MFDPSFHALSVKIPATAKLTKCQVIILLHYLITHAASLIIIKLPLLNFLTFSLLIIFAQDLIDLII